MFGSPFLLGVRIDVCDVSASSAEPLSDIEFATLVNKRLGELGFIIMPWSSSQISARVSL